ncbi:MAG: NTP transferase domain-containing protein [Vicingaceae bacterium]|nr:NTP transferase domain-containing protein [Vicingaceae bacterium]
MFADSSIIKNRISTIILAGGHSSRMNYPKAWLMYNNKETFLESIINIYIKVGIKPIVVLNEVFTNNQWKPFLERMLEKAIVIKNYHPEKGRLYSLALGLSELKTEEATFIHNIDQPFIELEVLNELLNSFEPNGITLPSINGKNGHPVLIGKPVIDEIKNHYSEHQTLRDVWKIFPKRKVEVNSENVLININTIKEYESLPQRPEYSGRGLMANLTRGHDPLPKTKLK